MWDCEKLDDEEKQIIGTDGKTKPDPSGESHSYSYALSMSIIYNITNVEHC